MSETVSEDILGRLLPLLSISDVKHVSLACRSWHAAIQHRLRALRPLYLPPSPPKAFNSLVQLQLPLIRSTTASAVSACQQPRWFTSVAPLGAFRGIRQMIHAADLDLSGQTLPADAMQLLGKHLTRLQTLKLDGCTMPLISLQDISTLTVLQQLSLAGVQLVAHIAACCSTAAAVGHEQTQQHLNSNRQQDATGINLGTALDAVLQANLVALNLDIYTVPQDTPFSTNQVFSRRYDGLPLLSHGTKLTQLTAVQRLGLLNNIINSRDWQAVCRLQQLTELHISWVCHDHDLQLLPQNGVSARQTGLDHRTFTHLSQLTALQALTLHMQGDSMYEPYSLAPLANTLTAVQLKGCRSLALVLSLMECTKIEKLQLLGLREPGTDELIVQVVRCMPLLRQLEVSGLALPAEMQYGLRHSGDYLLAQLDCCCPQLTELLLPDVPLNGTGFKQLTHAQTMSTGGTVSTSLVQQCGCLKGVQHLELCASQLMRAIFPYLAQLTSLRSLKLNLMSQYEFLQACRLNCFRPFSALLHLTSLRITAPDNHQPAQPIQHLVGLWDQDQNNAEPANDDIALQHGEAAAPEAMQLDDQDDADAATAADSGGGSEAATDSGESEFDKQDTDAGWHDAQQQHHGAGDEADSSGMSRSTGSGASSSGSGATSSSSGASSSGSGATSSSSNEASDSATSNDASESNDHTMQTASSGYDSETGGSEPDNDAVLQLQDAAVAAAAAAAQGELGAVLQAIAVDGQQQPQPGMQAQQQVHQLSDEHGQPRRSSEPHLHFLTGLTNLVELELGCLWSSGGLCLKHLAALTNLHRLALRGTLHLDVDTLVDLVPQQHHLPRQQQWQQQPGLCLPRVTTLSLAGCTANLLPCASAAANALRLQPTVANSGARSVKTRHQRPSTADVLIQALSCAFPNCVNLEYGGCDGLTAHGFEGLVRSMQHLQRARLLGMREKAFFAFPALREVAEQQQQQQHASYSVRKPGTSYHMNSLQVAAPPVASVLQVVFNNGSNSDLKYVEMCEGDKSTLNSGFSWRHAGKIAVFVRHDGKFVECKG